MANDTAGADGHAVAKLNILRQNTLWGQERVECQATQGYLGHGAVVAHHRTVPHVRVLNRDSRPCT